MVVVAWLVALVLLRFLFRRELAVNPPNVEAVMKLNPRETLDDWKTARRVLIVLGRRIFTLFPRGMAGNQPGFVALGAAAAALVWTRPNIQETLQRIEWSVLVFFGALFVMVGGLEAAGVLGPAGQWLQQPGADSRRCLLGVIMIWVVAGLVSVCG